MSHTLNCSNEPATKQRSCYRCYRLQPSLVCPHGLLVGRYTGSAPSDKDQMYSISGTYWTTLNDSSHCGLTCGRCSNAQRHGPSEARVACAADVAVIRAQCGLAPNLTKGTGDRDTLTGDHIKGRNNKAGLRWRSVSRRCAGFASNAIKAASQQMVRFDSSRDRASEMLLGRCDRKPVYCGLAALPSTSQGALGFRLQGLGA